MQIAFQLHFGRPHDLAQPSVTLIKSGTCVGTRRLSERRSSQPTQTMIHGSGTKQASHLPGPQAFFLSTMPLPRVTTKPSYDQGQRSEEMPVLGRRND